MEDKKLQIKVGLLVLLAAGLLGGFIFVLGDFSVGKGFSFHVTFSSSGDLAQGAAVRVAGMKVGKVKKLAFMPDAKPDAKGKRPVIHLTLEIEEKARPLIRKDSIFYITARGVLGEKYVGVTPGSEAEPAVTDGQTFAGQDPPQTDLVVAKLMDFVDDIANMLKKDGHLIRRILVKGGDLLEVADSILRENRGEVKNIVQKGSNVMDKVATMIDEARPVIGDVRATLAMAKKHLGERGRVGVILRNVEALTNVARREAPEIISKVKTIADKGSVVMDKAGTLADKAVAFADDGRALVADVRGLLGAQSGKITKIVDRVLGIGDQASKVMSLVHAMVARIARGEGSIGALLKDDELYDNIREIMRDLKQHPWKVLWKD
jgi:phospholipid/cholesterol/gamma-HCH transport system substrate-binding protein